VKTFDSYEVRDFDRTQITVVLYNRGDENRVEIDIDKALSRVWTEQQAVLNLGIRCGELRSAPSSSEASSGLLAEFTCAWNAARKERGL
jgi:hypothetical protein